MRNGKREKRDKRKGGVKERNRKTREERTGKRKRLERA